MRGHGRSKTEILAHRHWLDSDPFETLPMSQLVMFDPAHANPPPARDFAPWRYMCHGSCTLSPSVHTRIPSNVMLRPNSYTTHEDRSLELG
jgi:hypothetical protein